MRWTDALRPDGRQLQIVGIRGIKMVPDRWTAEDQEVQPLLRSFY